jgi:2-methylcitrate dehydratase
VVVTIHTSDGRQLTRQLDYPKGDPRNPLSDREIEEKFDALAGPVLSAAARAKVKDAVWNLESLGSVSELMTLLKARGKRREA